MFSVVIPVFNHAKYLREAVESCTAAPLVTEILLADDGSRDDSLSVIKLLAETYPGRVRDLTTSLPGNIGAHNRLNQLCREATQSWIAVLNSDDFFPAHRFELVRELARIHMVDFVSGSLLIVDEEGRVIGTKRGISQPEYQPPEIPGIHGCLNTVSLRTLLCSQNFIATTSNMVFRRSLFDAIGGFSDFRYSHDWDFALRATMLGQCLYTPNFLACYRVHRTNTISEQSPHMDGEIVRLFYKFLEDFPQVEADGAAVASLKSNRHLGPYVSKPKLLQPDWEPKPNTSPTVIATRARLNALLGRSHFGYDVVVSSEGLDLPPIIRTTALESAVYQFPESQGTLSLQASFRGRIMRNPIERRDKVAPSDLKSFSIFRRSVVRGHDIFQGTNDGSAAPDHIAYSALAELLRPLDNRPICIVLPAFLAVGGVERNTIEVIRRLQKDFWFIVVTNEYATEDLGSLHYQLDQLCVPTLDLAEIGPRESHFALLSVLSSILRPQLVWICNGSPWLTENALQLRRLFAGSSIIDQQVYDTQLGFVEHYATKGVQCRDHFIAINRRIHELFLKKFRIPAHKVSLIYPLLQGDKSVESRLAPHAVGEGRRQLGISDGKKRIYVFVGRLTEQKNPLDFLQLVRAVSTDNDDRLFVMIGDGPLADACGKQIQALGINSIIRVPFTDNPSRYFAVADGMIITSRYEGLPIAMLEAMAVGLPILATDVGDIREVLESFGTGCIFPSAEYSESWPAAFARWERELPGLRTKSLACRDAVVHKFGADTISQQYMELFTSLLGISIRGGGSAKRV